MQDVTEFLANVSQLSSGTEEGGETIFSALFSILKTAGDWADNVAKLLGLLG